MGRRRSRGARNCALAAIAMVGLLAACGGGSGGTHPDIVRNVLVPGESGSVPAGIHSTDQIPLYDGLTPLTGNVTGADLNKYFKAETLGDTSGTLEKTTRAGVRIYRDAYDVPHIFGDTRADAEFGAGWVAAEDRGLLMEAIRGPGRIAALDVPGMDALQMATTLQQFDPSAQTEQFLSSQLHLASKYGAEGKQVLDDVKNYVGGINAYYAKTHNSAPPWTVNDVIAATALIGAVFGRGGGGEVHNAEILAELEQKLGATEGLKVFRDLREAQDPEAPTTITQRFVYEPVPAGPTPGSLVVDPHSVQTLSPLTPHRHMSNVQLIDSSRSADGHPVAVMGPQVGYYYPEILMEMDIHGGGLDARGATFPGTSLYVELGRGAHFAWSATSSGSDNVDQFLDQLCNPDGSTPTRSAGHYLFDGKCIAMTTFDAGYLHGSGSNPGGEIVFNETVHGPVSGTATVDGKPYAISTERSTRGREVVSALGFSMLNDGSVHDPRSFLAAAAKIEFTFNWFYADAHHIAYYSSGRLPVRAPGTDPSLPTLGTGQYEWRGWLSPSEHPQAVDPSDGIFLNWNNKPAPGWGAADDNWSEGPIDHVQLFAPFAASGVRLQDVVSIMNKAATEDDRVVLVWPTIAKVLAGSPAPDAITKEAVDLVTQWAHEGGARIDRNGSGKDYAPGTAILDAAWPAIVDADLRPVLGDISSIVPGDGNNGYLDKDLRTILGEPVRGRFSRVYCGGGDLGACRASLWAALQAAADKLAAEQGPDPAKWREDAGHITFVPGILPAQIRSTNRPTFQQVVEFWN